METRMLGKLEVSAVGLGCNNFGRRIDRERSFTVVGAALEAGVTLFDTADVYGDGLSEEYLGAALRGRRHEAVVATKFGGLGRDERGVAAGRPEFVHQACEDSLRRLGVDHIDLYQMHRPDDETPIEETLGALDELIDAGKVREIGCSNFSAGQIDWAQRSADDRGATRFCSVQNQYSLLHRDPETDGVLDTCRQHGLGFLPYFPLASGMLTGKYIRGQAPPEGSRLARMAPEAAARHLSSRNFEMVEGLDAFARDRGRSVLDVAVAWLAAQPTVTSVIAGASSPGQVRANADAARWHPSDDELAEIGRLAAMR